MGALTPTDESLASDGHESRTRSGLLQNENRITVFFILATGLVLFFNLWAKSLENHGYLRYAEIAREMIRSGDWVVPHHNGGIYVDKPPLIFWLMAIPSWFYGSVTPLTARLSSALSAWAGVVVLFLWGRRVYGTIQAGLISGGLCLISFQYFFEGRNSKADMLLCLLTVLSLYFLYLGYDRDRRKSFLLYGLSFFCMGLGVLTKGPLGIVIPFLIVVAFLLKERQLKILVSREFLVGYVVLVIVALPWFVLFIQKVGWDQTISLLESNRVLTRRAPIYFYFLKIWGEFFPLSLTIPFLFVHFWRKRGERLQRGESFLLIWFVLLFILLTLFTFRASRYLLPAMPPLALMAGGMLRKRFPQFVAVFCLFVLVWHGVDWYRVQNNLSRSPGMVLVGELRPVLGGAPLSGYKLDVNTLEELNFYLDRVTHIVKEVGQLPGKKFILMPEKVFGDLQSRGHSPLQILREFRYEGERLFLISTLD
jgi:4-amino-4-deoxy-L-arabinose transferase-like glycosyltransferase